MMQDHEIELSVMSNDAPGRMWWSRVTAVATSAGTTVTDTVADNPQYSWPEVMLVRTTPEPDCFRGLVSVLADDADGGIPASVIDDVCAFGLEGWRADFAKFCWVRDYQDYPLLGRDFVDFDDWHLEHIYQQAGALSDLYKPRKKALRPSFHDAFWQMRGDCGDIEALANKRLSQIAQGLNLTGQSDFWATLVGRVHDLATQARSEEEAAAKKLAAERAPILAYADHAIWQRVSGGGALGWSLGNGLRRSGIVEYIQSYLKSTGTYPVGRHTVPYFSRIENFSRPSPPIATVEVQFPEEC
jgi:hypothetical protein